LGVDKEEVTAGNGSDELLNIIAETFLKDGDKVLTLKPDFSMYKFYSELRRAKVKEYGVEVGAPLDINQIIKAARGVKIIFFSNPCNPTGAIIPREDVFKLASSVSALVVADEAYMDFSNQSVATLVKDLPNLIVMRTLSKAGGIASARLGFAVSNIKLSKLLKTVKSPYNVNLLSQCMGEATLEEAETFKLNIASIIEARNYLYESLAPLNVVLGSPFAAFKSEANFVYIKTPKAYEIRDLLKKNGIAIRAFSGALRITAGFRSETDEVIKFLV
jgi:histidinol-phosphate aminotransferase